MQGFVSAGPVADLAATKKRPLTEQFCRSVMTFSGEPEISQP
jgi:hypothetical protein